MTPEQEEKFINWIYSTKALWVTYREAVEDAWQACLEANGIGEIPAGYFKIGEEVEFRRAGEKDFEFGTIGIYGPFEQTIMIEKVELVRRIPAWKPNKGDLVFFKHQSGHGFPDAVPVKILDVLSGDRYGFVGCPNLAWHVSQMKPFDSSKIGLNWDEI